MTTTETTTTTLAFHHLDDPHLGDQEASLDMHPRLPTTSTLLTTLLADLHGFRTQGLLEALELPAILRATWWTSWRTAFSWRTTSWISVLPLDTVPVSTSTTGNP